MDNARNLLSLVEASGIHRKVLEAVARLDLPDAWIAAGFIRNLVWDAAHGFERPTAPADIDVVFFHAGNLDPDNDRKAEERLGRILPGLPWSVRNQARMHRRNHDRPYRSTEDALVHWCETPTPVALRRNRAGGLDLLAPLGLDDLFDLIVRPTPHFIRAGKLDAYRARMQAKNWPQRWPRLRLLETGGAP